jgi:hypothetical protein
MFTFQDARREKHLQDAKLFAKSDERNRQEKVITDILQARPEIGVLQRGDRRVYYTMSGGYREANHPTLLC